jgi:hypothetical protein
MAILKRQRQENHKFEPAWATQQGPGKSILDKDLF